MQKEVLLKAINIYKSFNVDGIEQKVLENISFETKKGEFVCLIGPSGCGKSTLLRIISGLVSTDSGLIERSKKLKFSFVFQDFALFPWLNVENNVGFGLKMQGQSEKEIKETVLEHLREMSLDGFEYKHPRELSGGMKQRVGFARALAIKPDVLLLDEPFSALDAFSATKLRKDLIDIWLKDDLTIIMVSHLLEEAVELADKVIVMSANPGKVKKEIKIDLPRPRDKRSKEFFGYVDILNDLIEIND